MSNNRAFPVKYSAFAGIAVERVHDRDALGSRGGRVRGRASCDLDQHDLDLGQVHERTYTNARTRTRRRPAAAATSASDSDSAPAPARSIRWYEFSRARPLIRIAASPTPPAPPKLLQNTPPRIDSAG